MLSVGSLFSGDGLLDLGLHLAGLEHRWLCERDPDRRHVLAQRFPAARIYDDVRAVGVDAEPVAVVAGGFPCKGASSIGKREGFGHPETVLWREMARAIGELRPRYVVVENVANILGLHDGAVWGEVLGDLAACGYDTVWDCVPAAAFGACHLRDRVFAIAAHPADLRPERAGRAWDGWSGPPNGHTSAPDASRDAERGPETPAGAVGERARTSVEWGRYEPAIRRWERVHGPAPEPRIPGVDARSAAKVVRSRLSALGDGVQVQIGEMVGRYLMEMAR